VAVRRGRSIETKQSKGVPVREVSKKPIPSALAQIKGEVLERTARAGDGRRQKGSTRKQN